MDPYVEEKQQRACISASEGPFTTYGNDDPLGLALLAYAARLHDVVAYLEVPLRFLFAIRALFNRVDTKLARPETRCGGIRQQAGFNKKESSLTN